MPATADRAQFIRQEFRSASNGPVAAVVTAFGELARRTREPIETFFESEADAQALCDERMVLLGASNRRMSLAVSGEQTGMDMAYIGTSPTVTVIDDDRALNGDMLVTEFAIDFGAEQTTAETWGGSLTDYRITTDGDLRVTTDGDARRVSS